MNREIKFRAWDIDSSEMIYTDMDKGRNDFFFDFTDGKLNLMCPVEDDFAELRKANIMQYTGLKDKNGKEIYEGDVLSKSNECQVRYSVRFDSKNLAFTSSCWRLDDDENNETFWKCIYSDHSISGALTYENLVIGNIFETPELLNP